MIVVDTSSETAGVQAWLAELGPGSGSCCGTPSSAGTKGSAAFSGGHNTLPLVAAGSLLPPVPVEKRAPPIVAAGDVVQILQDTRRQHRVSCERHGASSIRRHHHNSERNELRHGEHLRPDSVRRLLGRLPPAEPTTEPRRNGDPPVARTGCRSLLPGSSHQAPRGGPCGPDRRDPPKTLLCRSAGERQRDNPPANIAIRLQ